MSAERIADLYRELALHRVGEAIEALGASPTDRLAAQSADALEEAAAALACMTALYTSPGGVAHLQGVPDAVGVAVAGGCRLDHDSSPFAW